MKTMKYISLRVLAIAALALAFAMPAKAQLSDNGYANVDWQFNAPLKNHFADKASGWGMNFEGGYFVTPNLFRLGYFVIGISGTSAKVSMLNDVFYYREK